MKKIAKYLLAAMLVVIAQCAFAQDATKILDKASAAMKSAGNVKVGFTMSAEGGSQVGYIKLSGQKFVVNMGGNVTWFDGTTMWNYVKKNEEVNVTNPTAAEVAKMNPYAFITFYKKGYTAKMGKSTSKEYEIVLTGQGNAPFSNVVLKLNKSTYMPQSIKMTSAKAGTTTIVCNSIAKNQKFSASTFQFNKKNYPKAEIVDLR